MSEIAEKIAREVQSFLNTDDGEYYGLGTCSQCSVFLCEDHKMPALVAIIDRHLEPSPHEQLRTDIETVIHEHSNAYPIENFSRLTRGLIKMLRTKYFMR